MEVIYGSGKWILMRCFIFSGESIWRKIGYMCSISVSGAPSTCINLDLRPWGWFPNTTLPIIFWKFRGRSHSHFLFCTWVNWSNTGYPANNSSPPMPESATVIPFAFIALETTYVFIPSPLGVSIASNAFCNSSINTVGLRRIFVWLVLNFFATISA